MLSLCILRASPRTMASIDGTVKFHHQIESVLWKLAKSFKREESLIFLLTMDHALHSKRRKLIAINKGLKMTSRDFDMEDVSAEIII